MKTYNPVSTKVEITNSNKEQPLKESIDKITEEIKKGTVYNPETETPEEFFKRMKEEGKEISREKQGEVYTDYQHYTEIQEKQQKWENLYNPVIPESMPEYIDFTNPKEDPRYIDPEIEAEIPEGEPVPERNDLTHPAKKELLEIFGEGYFIPKYTEEEKDRTFDLVERMSKRTNFPLETDIYNSASFFFPKSAELKLIERIELQNGDYILRWRKEYGKKSAIYTVLAPQGVNPVKFSGFLREIILFIKALQYIQKGLTISFTKKEAFEILKPGKYLRKHFDKFLKSLPHIKYEIGNKINGKNSYVRLENFISDVETSGEGVNTRYICYGTPDASPVVVAYRKIDIDGIPKNEVKIPSYIRLPIEAIGEVQSKEQILLDLVRKIKNRQNEYSEKTYSLKLLLRKLEVSPKSIKLKSIKYLSKILEKAFHYIKTKGYDYNYIKEPTTIEEDSRTERRKLTKKEWLKLKVYFIKLIGNENRYN